MVTCTLTISYPEQVSDAVCRLRVESTLYYLFFLHVHKPIASFFTLFKLIFLFSLYCVVQHVRECMIYNDLISVRSLQLKEALNVWAKRLVIVGL